MHSRLVLPDHGLPRVQIEYPERFILSLKAIDVYQEVGMPSCPSQFFA